MRFTCMFGAVKNSMARKTDQRVRKNLESAEISLARASAHANLYAKAKNSRLLRGEGALFSTQTVMSN
jgi:hypothetical protein